MNEILEPKLEPSICDLLQVFLFFKKILVPCHFAAVCKKRFEDNHMSQLEWCENSSDINLIKILWG